MYKLIIPLMVSLVTNATSFSQNFVSSEFIDSIVNVSMEKFPQAGVAIGVIQDGKVTHLKGYGIASKNRNSPVDETTLFAIASNSKAFTATALGILVDRGKLSWEDRVIDHIPEFRMYESYVTENFTIVDLLTHRSGLGLGAGDLMFFPDGADFTIDDVVRSFQHQTPVSDFRTKYDYDNLLYIVAGEVVHRVSGKSWDAFVEDEILSKLGMRISASLYSNISDLEFAAAPHKIENDKVVEIDPYIKEDGGLGAAGGIYSNVSDMCKWVQMHLNHGLYGENLEDTLLSKSTHQELWKLHTNIYFNATPGGLYNTHYKGYGLGFFLQDQNGYTIVDHSGGLPGMLSMVTMIPELNAGIVVLTNSHPGGLSLVTLTNEIKDEIIGAQGIDWIGWAEGRLKTTTDEADSVVNAVWEQVKKSAKTKLDYLNYTGTYEDNWFGKVEVYEENGKLWFKSLRSPKLHGEMRLYKASTFAIAWNYRDMDCDAFAIFQLDENGKATAISMKGISPAIDFSFDFQDLDLRKISN